MLSRVADALYWTSRYVERVENTARLISVNSYLTLDLPPDLGHWEPLVEAMGDRGLFESHYDSLSGSNVVQFLTSDPNNPNSILSTVDAARSNANSVRDFITLEMWEQLNGLFLKMHETTVANDAPQEFFKGVVRACQLIEGITDATMSHDEGWHFVRLGRMLERADKTSRMLEVRYLFSVPDHPGKAGPYDDILWAALLRSTSALQMYRKRHHRIVPERLVAFLVLDHDFPRSIRHCIAEAEEAVRAISETPDSTFQNRAEQVLGRLRAFLDYMHVDEIMDLGVHKFIDTLQIKLNEASDAVLETFCAVPEEAPSSSPESFEAARSE
jgi:uncharacterized alpha-E superfamily protein